MQVMLNTEMNASGYDVLYMQHELARREIYKRLYSDHWESIAEYGSKFVILFYDRNSTSDSTVSDDWMTGNN
jgi:hypothetical protein